jgi:hypothetical protein
MKGFPAGAWRLGYVVSNSTSERWFPEAVASASDTATIESIMLTLPRTGRDGGGET